MDYFGDREEREHNKSIVRLLEERRSRPGSPARTPNPPLEPLDLADRAVLRIADERDEIQKKTFTKWVNKHIIKHWKHDEARKQVTDLYEDMRDGHNLISLLEVLSQEIIPRERGRLRFHRLQNVQNALDFLRYKKIKLVNIRNDDIVDGNAKLTLGLIWTIILHFQISDIIVTGQPDDRNVKEALLLWSRRTTDGYPGVNIKDFSRSWRDGLAFNAILHRNRPELIDFKSLSRDDHKANLENAFSVAENHFGVTRLLDPEDVDRVDPDDKSIMTYVSSMYDVFPEVPNIESSLADNERALRWEEYQDYAGRLMQWVTHSTALMEDRNFPNNLQDTRQLLQQFNQYRLETVPPKMSEKHKVLGMFKELEKLFAPTGQFHVPQGLDIHDIEQAWDRLMIAQQERDKMLRSEINRLENLYLLGEKVQRQIRRTTDTLDGLERRIEADEPRIDKMHPADAKKRVDQIDAGLKMCETAIREMFNDTQALKDGQYYQADIIYRRVFNLHERWLALRNRLHTNLTSKVATMTLTTEETTLTKRYETRTEYRVVETNEIFKFIQECLIWIQNKQAAIDSLDYGNDLPSVQRYLRQHSEEHRVITEFKTNIDRCRDAKSNLSGDEYTLYSQHLSRLEQVYASLLDSSAKRIKDLELLLEFMQAATTELMWLNEKEETEVSRDWSAKNLDVPELEQYFQNLLSELQNREGQFKIIQNNGQQLVLHSHPASQTIEAYLQAMTSQWEWLLQLTICLEQHLKHAAAYHQFYGDAHGCEQWLSDQAELLNRKYDRSDLSLEESTDLLQELFEMKEKLMEYKDVVSDLVVRSKHIVPLKQRKQYPEN
ncbi:plectin-like [Saccoglossus kowalevskii]